GDRLLALLHAVVMVLRQRNADRRVVEGGAEGRDAFAIARADQAVRGLRGDFPHVPQDFAAAVWPWFQRIGEGRDFVVAFPEEGLIGEGVVHAIEEVLSQDDVVRVRRRLVMPIPMRLVEVMVGDRAGRHDDVDQAELHHVSHHFLQAARRPGARAPEEDGAFRVGHHVLQDGGAEAQGPRLERDVLVAVDEVRDRLRLLEVEVFDRDGGEIRLRRLLVRHARRYAAPGQKGSVGYAFLRPSTASAIARAFSFGREQTAYSSPSKNTSRSGCCRWISWIRCMMSLRVIDSSFGSIRMTIRFSLSVPKARPSSGLVETVRFVRPYKYYSGLETHARGIVPRERGNIVSMILRWLRLNTLFSRSDSQPVLPGRSC